jgi:hypothetical protein
MSAPLPPFLRSPGAALLAGLCLLAAPRHNAAAQTDAQTAASIMACQFTSGPLTGAAYPLPADITTPALGAPCTDNAGSRGRIGLAQLTTICGFTSGPMAGTRFDLGRYGAPELPVGTPCTDNGGSTGTLIPNPDLQ